MLGRWPGTEVFHNLSENPDSETYPGLLIIRFDGPLNFATTNALRHKVRAVTTDVAPPVTEVLIDMEGVDYLDLEGSDMLGEITKDMRGVGVEIHLARVEHAVRELLEKDGVDQIIGRDHIHDKVVVPSKCLATRRSLLRRMISPINNGCFDNRLEVMDV